MRQFQTVMNITDLQGFPITGDRLLFLKDETNVATITDIDENPISNPVKIVNGHTEVQVFLPDVNVKVVHQTCIDEENDVWDDVDSWYDVMPTIDVNVHGGTPYVDTIAELKALVTSTGSVNVLGYNVAGDKPSINYRWNSSSTEDEDNGRVIKSSLTDTGRWIALFEEDYVDVRHYGIFPHNSKNCSQNTAIASAYVNIASVGKKMYFPCEGNKLYYNISGCSIFNAKFDTGVRVFANTAVASLTECDNVNVASSDYKVRLFARSLRTSQNKDKSSNVELRPSAEIILDTDMGLDMTWEDVSVVVKSNQTLKATFNRCRFSGNGKFNVPYTVSGQPTRFNGCDIVETMFATDADMRMYGFTNCTSSIRKWSSADKYMDFCIKNSSAVIDLEGNSTSLTCTLIDGIYVKNATLTGTVVLAGSATLDNCTMSNVTISGVDRLAMSNSAIASSTEVKVKYLIANTSSISCTTMVVIDSVIEGCSIDAIIGIAHGANNKVSGRIQDCTFSSRLFINILGVSYNGDEVGDGTLFVDNLVIRGNRYFGSKRAPVTFNADKMATAQGCYEITANSNVIGDTDNVIVNGKMRWSYDTLSDECYIKLSAPDSNKKITATLTGSFSDYLFSFGETSNTNWDTKELVLEYSGYQRSTITVGTQSVEEQHNVTAKFNLSAPNGGVFSGTGTGFAYYTDMYTMDRTGPGHYNARVSRTRSVTKDYA